MLTGACISRAGLNRKTALATAVLVISAEIADVDVLWYIKGRVSALEHHRGWTHSFVGLPAMAALSLLVVWSWKQVFGRSRIKPTAPAPPSVSWSLLFTFALLGGLSHIILDYSTAYGIRFLELFSYHWFSWDIEYIIDPLMLVVLGLGLLMPSLFGLVHEEIGGKPSLFRGRAGAIFALVAICIIWGVRDYQHRRAVAKLNARLYRGEEPLRVSAYPYPWNPFHWHGVVETTDFFETMLVDSAADVDSDNRARTYYKPQETPITLAAKQSQLGRVYLDWAAYPYVQQEQQQPSGGYIVRFYDLRYLYPDGRTPLSAYVELDTSLRVVAQDAMARNGQRRP